MVGPVRFELTSLRLKGECRYPLCDEPGMVSAAGFEPASACLRGRYNLPLYDALMVYVALTRVLLRTRSLSLIRRRLHAN